MAILCDHMDIDEEALPDTVDDVKIPTDFDYQAYIEEINYLYDENRHCLVKHEKDVESGGEIRSCEKQTMGSDEQSFVRILKDLPARHQNLKYSQQHRPKVSPGLVYNLLQENAKGPKPYLLDDVIRFIMQVETLAFSVPVLQELVYSVDQPPLEEELLLPVEVQVQAASSSGSSSSAALGNEMHMAQATSSSSSCSSSSSSSSSRANGDHSADNVNDNKFKYMRLNDSNIYMFDDAYSDIEEIQVSTPTKTQIKYPTGASAPLREVPPSPFSPAQKKALKLQAAGNGKSSASTTTAAAVKPVVVKAASTKTNGVGGKNKAASSSSVTSVKAAQPSPMKYGGRSRGEAPSKVELVSKAKMSEVAAAASGENSRRNYKGIREIESLTQSQTHVPTTTRSGLTVPLPGSGSSEKKLTTRSGKEVPLPEKDTSNGSGGKSASKVASSVKIKSKKVDFNSDDDTESDTEIIRSPVKRGASGTAASSSSSSSALNFRNSSMTTAERLEAARKTATKVVFPKNVSGGAEDEDDDFPQRAIKSPSNKGKGNWGSKGSVNDAVPPRATTGSDGPRKRVKFTFEEEEAIIEGYVKYGSAWGDIKKDPKLRDILKMRTDVDIKDKYRNLAKKGRTDRQI